MKNKISQSVIRKLVSLSMVLIMAMVFSVTAKSFFTLRNIFSIFREVSVIGLLSIGVTFVIIGGGIDISTGAIMAVSAMICSNLVITTLMPIWLIVSIAISAGVLCGLLNGLLVTKLKLSELITTFATMFIYRGIVYTLSFRDGDGRLITKAIMDKSFLAIASKWGDFYPMTLIWVAAVILGYIILKKNQTGHIYIRNWNRPKSRSIFGHQSRPNQDRNVFDLRFLRGDCRRSPCGVAGFGCFEFWQRDGVSSDCGCRCRRYCSYRRAWRHDWNSHWKHIHGHADQRDL